MPALDLNASYGVQGLGGTAFIRSGTGIESRVTGTIPGGYFDALSALSGRDYPTWNLNVAMSYPIGGNQAEAQYARARVQRNQATTRIRALEVQIAAEVANAALTVQSNLKRVEAATAARELAQKRLEAEQSKFDVGMTTNFFVVQAQRDLRDAANTELRALADYRKSLVNFERSQQSPAGGGGGGNFAAASSGFRFGFRSMSEGTETERFMRKFVVIAIVVAVAGGAAAYFGVFSREGDAAAAAGPQAGGPGGGGAPGASGRAGRGAQGGGGGFGGGGGGFPVVRAAAVAVRACR